MPQEIEVWHLIPALRRELAKFLIKDYGLTQKKVSLILGISEAAVSQYLKSKRAKEIQFSKKELEEIKLASKNIFEKPDSLIEILFDLSLCFRGSKTVCKLHRAKDSHVPKKCEVCMKGVA